MTEFKFTERAYAKMIFHAAKYPHLAVNGILLAEKHGKEIVQIVDAIPMFHQCLYVTPMVEIALTRIESFAERNGMVVAGYYAAAENFYDNSVEKAPAVKVADKIQENYKNACFAIIDNRLVSVEHDQAAVKVFSCTGESGRWSKATFTLQQSETTLEAVSSLLKRGAMKDVFDFDNHLDNPDNDWTNEFLNRNLKQLLTMY